MNKYLVYVTGSDSLGFSFIKNVVELSGKGGVLQEGKVPSLKFPHSAWFYYESEDEEKDRPGFKFQIIAQDYTREELDAMTWEQLKKVCSSRFGITGRDREVITVKYLKAISGSTD